MLNKDRLHNIGEKQGEWENNALKKALKKYPEREIISELSNKRLYTPLDLADFDYLKDVGFPGESPYTRGPHPTMYRSRLWETGQYWGFGMPEETREAFKLQLREGQQGISLACDLPTQLGYDSDEPIAEQDVGVVGTACPSLKEVEDLFVGIPMDKVPIRGSMSQLAIVLWSMFVAAAEKNGVPTNELSGNVVIDCLQEYIGRGNYVCAPSGAMRLSLDFLEWAIKHIPKLTYQVNVYTVREKGSTLVQEVAVALALTATYFDAALERGMSIDDIAPQWEFHTSTHMNFFEEIAKGRTLRRLWAKMMEEKYGAKKQASFRCRYGPATGGSPLTAQQAENNIVRTTIQALASILGGATYMNTSSFDEAYSIPTEKSMMISLMTHHILAYETGITDVVDPIGGSYYVESLTREIEKKVVDYINEIEAKGGMIKVIETGWIQAEIARSAYKRQKEIDEGKRTIVGVNKFIYGGKPDFGLYRPNPETVDKMKHRLQKMKQERDNNKVQQCLEIIRNTAQGKGNMVLPVLEAVKNYATIGEITRVFKDVFGEYKEPVFKG